MRTTIIALTLMCAACALQAQTIPSPRQRNKAVYLQAMILASTSDKLDKTGLPALSYEQTFLSLPTRRIRLAAAAGFTPPLSDDFKFAFHLGPKLYLGGPVKWFTVDIQYWGVFEKGYYYSSAGTTRPTSFNKYTYLGLGYCFTGKKGFFFNPEFLLAGYVPDKSHLNFGESDRGSFYPGVNLNFGFCF